MSDRTKDLLVISAIYLAIGGWIWLCLWVARL